MDNNVVNKTKHAIKWSAITEITSKLIAPITNMVLAHLLTPEAFGIIATIQMIISFVEIFTDAGFQKYIIQHQFSCKQELDDSVNIAFWSNFCISIFVWILISIFSEQIAKLVGNPGYGHIIIIACISIPLAAFTSIQMALYRKSLDYKTLFKVKIVGILVPIFITVPLAFYLRTFWALLIGVIAKDVINALVLTIYSKWKPRLFYSIERLKQMLSFTIWTMIESISIWLSGFADVFMVGTLLSQYYLGLYKTSITIVAQIMSIITVTTTPILFSSLSQLQHSSNQFEDYFLKFQKAVALFVIPISVLIFCYSDIITNIMLGSQWVEATNFIGLWGLTSGITIILGHYCSEIYRAKGKPRVSVLAQWINILFLWPTIYYCAQDGFELLYISRCIVRLLMIIVHLVIMHYIIKIFSWKMISNVKFIVLNAFLMGLCSFGLRTLYENRLWDYLTIVICVSIYVILTSLDKRNILLIQNFIKRK